MVTELKAINYEIDKQNDIIKEAKKELDNLHIQRDIVEQKIIGQLTLEEIKG